MPIGSFQPQIALGTQIALGIKYALTLCARHSCAFLETAKTPKGEVAAQNLSLSQIIQGLGWQYRRLRSVQMLGHEDGVFRAIA